MSRMWNWLKKEFREILPVWAFFFFAMGLLSFTVSAVLGKYHIELARPHEYLVGSLIMAKVVLIMDTFVHKEWLRGRPLIYPTLWKTGLYFIAAVAFNTFERLFTLVRRQHLGFDQATREILSNMVEPRYWVAMAWLIALIVVFLCLSRTDRFHRLRPLQGNVFRKTFRFASKTWRSAFRCRLIDFFVTRFCPRFEIRLFRERSVNFELPCPLNRQCGADFPELLRVDANGSLFHSF